MTTTIADELAAVRTRAHIDMERRIIALDTRRRAEGRDDRAAMGNPDPTLSEVVAIAAARAQVFADAVKRAFGRL